MTAKVLGPGWEWNQAWPPTMAAIVPLQLVENFEGDESVGTVMSMTDAKIAQLESRLQTLEAENTRLRARIRELEDESLIFRQRLQDAGEALLDAQQPRK